ncbi:hypothetical protein PHLGIDRAFT_18033 [Phlebiopsis gigantea 11061_1 CR5-6]|uniref:BRCT domain-containing protein n=1 Tax=Phlebiopsis gigantea (strain 11061_1 CR5-6) TaxID=745531 RepID=A0A0C3PUE6_PHLG1|nr:hypothetical protein PHLGIDRAFT_18033 [Phlebiopsis gigantea 11061_1 CR5-6]
MLQGMGAKIQNRAGQHCTHIVYKNGLVSTTNRYRALNDPKPLVVGIAWVVECAEKKARVDETKYLINLDHENVAGTKKRRISMIPKLMESPERPTPTGSNRPTNVHSSPPSTDTSANNSFDHLPPLERARRRQSALFSS